MCAGNETKLLWYSDKLTYELVYVYDESEIRVPESLRKVPAEDPSIPGTPLFLAADNPWFVAMQKVRPQLPTFSGSVALAVNARCCSFHIDVI
jgi:hypothetical protein